MCIRRSRVVGEPHLVIEIVGGLYGQAAEGPGRAGSLGLFPNLILNHNRAAEPRLSVV